MVVNWAWVKLSSKAGECAVEMTSVFPGSCAICLQAGNTTCERQSIACNHNDDGVRDGNTCAPGATAEPRCDMRASGGAAEEICTTDAGCGGEGTRGHGHDSRCGERRAGRRGLFDDVVRAVQGHRTQVRENE